MATKNIISKGGVFKKAPMPASGVLDVLVTTDDGLTYRLDKTWQEIYDSMPSVLVKWHHDDPDRSLPLLTVLSMTDTGDGLIVMVYDGENMYEFTAESADGYPATSE